MALRDKLACAHHLRFDETLFFDPQGHIPGDAANRHDQYNERISLLSSRRSKPPDPECPWFPHQVTHR
jgi:hypothetical protein